MSTGDALPENKQGGCPIKTNINKSITALSSYVFGGVSFALISDQAFTETHHLYPLRLSVYTNVPADFFYLK